MFVEMDEYNKQKFDELASSLSDNSEESLLAFKEYISSLNSGILTGNIVESAIKALFPLFKTHSISINCFECISDFIYLLPEDNV